MRFTDWLFILTVSSCPVPLLFFLLREIIRPGSGPKDSVC
jgi:hypothetical protein